MTPKPKLKLQKYFNPYRRLKIQRTVLLWTLVASAALAVVSNAILSHRAKLWEKDAHLWHDLYNREIQKKAVGMIPHEMPLASIASKKTKSTPNLWIVDTNAAPVAFFTITNRNCLEFGEGGMLMVRLTDKEWKAITNHYPNKIKDYSFSFYNDYETNHNGHLVPRR